WVKVNTGDTYKRWWHTPAGGKVFCLCEAPSAQAAEQVHRAAHGMMPERIIEVDPDLAEGMLGGGTVAATGTALLPRSAAPDPGRRPSLFTDIVGSTQLTQRLGDRAAMAAVELHDRVVRDALAHTFGREVKHLGDGMMSVFVAAGARGRW